MKTDKLCKALKNRIDIYLDQAEKVRTDSSPETIHDFRVASRYLLAIEPLMHFASDTKTWRKKLKHDLKALTRLRDLHVFTNRFSDNPELIAQLIEATRLESDTTVALRSQAGDKNFEKELHNSFHAFCSSEHKKSTIDSQVYAVWMRHWNALIEKLRAIDYENPVSIHRLRIRFKPFRYLASFLHESELVSISSFDAFKHWQDIMGDINDLEVVSAWLEQQAGYESLALQLNKEAALLRQKLQPEEMAFRAFIEHIHVIVLSKTGFHADAGA